MRDPVVVNVLHYAKMPYDTQRAFAPITLAATAGLILVVHPSMPVKTAKDLVVPGNTRPGQLTYGSSGSGSTTHLAGALFTSMTGVQMIHDPVKHLNIAPAAWYTYWIPACAGMTDGNVVWKR